MDRILLVAKNAVKEWIDKADINELDQIFRLIDKMSNDSCRLNNVKIQPKNTSPFKIFQRDKSGRGYTQREICNMWKNLSPLERQEYENV